MTGTVNRADGDGSTGGMALDDIAQRGPHGGVGSGGMVGGAGAPGVDPLDPGNPGNPSSGGGSPFDDVGGGGTTGNSGGSGGGECSGSVCTADTPVGNLFGGITIRVSLHLDPTTQGGDCNTLWPPKEQRQVCRYVDKRDGLGKAEWFAGLIIGNAHALPVEPIEVNDGNESTRELVCSMQTIQPPIDSNLVPKVAVDGLRPFYSYSSETYKKTLIPQCGANGKWLAETESIRVPFSPYPDGNNTWDFRVDALYPENGTWLSKGTRDLKIKCRWDSSSTEVLIKCEEEVALPAVQVAPDATNQLSQ